MRVLQKSAVAFEAIFLSIAIGLASPNDSSWAKCFGANKDQNRYGCDADETKEQSFSLFGSSDTEQPAVRSLEKEQPLGLDIFSGLNQLFSGGADNDPGQDVPEVTADDVDFVSYPPPTGPKRTIGVLTVETQAQNQSQNQAQNSGQNQYQTQLQNLSQSQITSLFGNQGGLPSGSQGQSEFVGEQSSGYLAEMIVTELVRSGHFVVLYDDVSQTLGQRYQEGSEKNQQATGMAKALMSAQLLVKTVVKRFGYQNSNSGTGFTFNFGNFNLGMKSDTAIVEMDIHLIDPSSSQIIDSRPITAKASTSGYDLSFAKSGQKIQLGSDAFQKSPLGQATNLAVQKTVSYIIDKSHAIPWWGRIIRANAGRAHVNRGLNYNLSVGDNLMIYSKGEDLIDPETGLNLGADEKVIGTLILTTVKEKFAVGKYDLFNKQDVVKRGDVVRISDK